MDGIFDNLLHTERSTEKILKDAETEKAALITRAAEETESFDRSEQEMTANQLAAQREKILSARQTKLEALEASVKNEILHIQNEYDIHKSEWAEAITRRILEN